MSVPSPTPGRLPHVAALDGVRGVAVAGVLAFHGGVSWAAGGFLGVDAFFVLSGYLITALLVAERATTGRTDLRAFWVRRARRLLPALVVFVLAVAAAAPLLLDDRGTASLTGDGLAALGYVANWWFIATGDGYFAAFAAPSLFEHTWSLAVEEQWYVLWPLVLAGVAVLGRQRWRTWLLAGCVVGAGASAGLMAVLHTPAGDPSRVYLGTDARAQGLLVGSALALVLAGAAGARAARAVTVAARVLVGPAVVGLAWSWSTTTGASTRLFEGGFLVHAVAVAVVIAAVADGRATLPARALAAAPLVWLGRLSYSLYLWHWPVFVVLTERRTGLDGPGLLAVRLAVSGVLAVLSYVLVEQPVRLGRTSPAVLRWAAPFTVAAAAGALVLPALPAARSGSAPAGGPVDGVPVAPLPAAPAPAATAPAAPALSTTAATARPMRLLVAGDSVAFTLGQGLERLARTRPELRLTVMNTGTLGCGVVRGGRAWVDGVLSANVPTCDAWPDRFDAALLAFSPDTVLLKVGAWDLFDRELDGGVWLRFGSPEYRAHLAAEVGAAVDRLAATGARVVVATSPYLDKRDVVNRPPEFRSAFDPARVDLFNEVVRQVAAERPGRVEVLDVHAWACPDPRCARVEGGVEVRPDGVHYGPEGADVAAAWVVRQLGVDGGQGR